MVPKIAENLITQGCFSGVGMLRTCAIDGNLQQLTKTFRRSAQMCFPVLEQHHVHLTKQKPSGILTCLFASFFVQLEPSRLSPTLLFRPELFLENDRTFNPFLHRNLRFLFLWNRRISLRTRLPVKIHSIPGKTRMKTHQRGEGRIWNMT